MAETGIEDLIQNGPDGPGCLASLGIGLGFLIIVCIILGLVGSYCGPSEQHDPPAVSNAR